MIELDTLPLFYSAVVCDNALSSKKRPLREAIKRFVTNDKTYPNLSVRFGSVATLPPSLGASGLDVRHPQ